MEVTGIEFSQKCPLTGGDHKYFISKTLEVFEPTHLSAALYEILSDRQKLVMDEAMREQTFYIKKEYAILGCNCSSVVRREIQHGY